MNPPGKRYICNKCGRIWWILPNFYNLFPEDRKKGSCYCNKKFPKIPTRFK